MDATDILRRLEASSNEHRGHDADHWEADEDRGKKKCRPLRVVAVQ